VGIANARPDSFTPRRFMAIRAATKKMLMPTRYALSCGAAEMMLSTPAATDTATVMM
jgi:NADH:ubiquinone oxidoreductase subunit B-like Fe-S oxidoreductase